MLCFFVLLNWTQPIPLLCLWKGKGGKESNRLKAPKTIKRTISKRCLSRKEIDYSSARPSQEEGTLFSKWRPKKMRQEMTRRQRHSVAASSESSSILDTWRRWFQRALLLKVLFQDTPPPLPAAATEQVHVGKEGGRRRARKQGCHTAQTQMRFLSWTNLISMVHVT